MNDSQEWQFHRAPWERVSITKRAQSLFIVLSNGLEQRQYRSDFSSLEEAQEQLDRAVMECLMRGFTYA
jgi:hypothetical protein